MPTTATVAAAPRSYTAEEIASGLHAFAEILEAKPDLADGISFPSVPQHISFGVTDRDHVDAFASIFDATVEEAEHGDHSYVRTSGQLGGLRISVYTVVDASRLLRRDPEATDELAERDA